MTAAGLPPDGVAPLVAVLLAVAVLSGRPGAAGRRLRRVGRRPGGSGLGGGGPAASAQGRRRWSPGRRGAADVSTAEVALLLDLVATGLSGGLSPVQALEVAGRACPGPAGDVVARVTALWLLGAGEDVAWAGAPAALEPVRRSLRLVASSGVAGVSVLRWAADDLRRRERREAEARAEALGVRLVLPLGLCALPAFAAWAVVPVVMSLARGVLG